MEGGKHGVITGVPQALLSADASHPQGVQVWEWRSRTVAPHRLCCFLSARRSPNDSFETCGANGRQYRKG